MAQNDNGYTQTQITAMQRDAVRRVNEMQRISNERLKNSSIPSNQAAQSAQHAATADNRQQHNQYPKNNNTPPVPNTERCEAEVVSGGFKGILERLNLDNEKILVILLLILLINEGGDIMLILAMVYILL